MLTSVDLAAYSEYSVEDDLEMDKLTLVQNIGVFVLVLKRSQQQQINDYR